MATAPRRWTSWTQLPRPTSPSVRPEDLVTHVTQCRPTSVRRPRAVASSTPDVSGPAPTFWGSRRTARRHGSWSTGRSCRCARSRSRQTNETRRGGADPRRQGSATQGTQTAAGADHCGRPVPVGARVCCSSSPTRGYPSGSSRRARNGWPRQRSGSGRPYSTGVDRLRGPGPGPARRLRRREGRLPRALDRKEHKNSAHRIDRAAASAAASTVQPGPQLFVFDEADT